MPALVYKIAVYQTTHPKPKTAAVHPSPLPQQTS